ncbi:MAG: hypothetical protein OXH92_19370 [Bryobacterales bacterium]|nr:hypothetical protein [Bryobacterales bacterium]MDE0295339.1 hypothetical protein [Bryobacterales bacterium]MDE0436168.1 hypothetical protein [Bryobacterales bacterium]
MKATLRAPFSSARLATRPDGPLTHFTSPRGEKSRLDHPKLSQPAWIAKAMRTPPGETIARTMAQTQSQPVISGPGTVSYLSS